MHSPSLQRWGVASCASLVARGARRSDIDSAVRRRELARVRNGWVCRPDADSEVVRAVRVGGALSCVSALTRHGVWCMPDSRPHVRVGARRRHVRSPDDRHRRLQREALVHLSPRPIEAPVDDVLDSLLCVVRCQPRSHAVAALDSALHQRLVTIGTLRRALEPYPERCRALLGLTDSRSESGLESIFRLALRSVNIPATPQVRIGGVGRVDLLVGERLVVELDGARYHSEERAFAADRHRDLTLVGLGYHVLRLTYGQTFSDEPLRVVRSLVSRGEHRWSSRHLRQKRRGSG